MFFLSCQGYPLMSTEEEKTKHPVIIKTRYQLLFFLKSIVLCVGKTIYFFYGVKLIYLQNNIVLIDSNIFIITDIINHFIIYPIFVSYIKNIRGR